MLAAHRNEKEKMDIFLLRHGAYNQNTLNESLSASGRKQVESIAKYLSQVGFSAGKILSSPKTRAHESADIIAKAVGLDPGLIVETPFLKPSSSAADVVNLAQNSSSRQLLLTGHLPSIAETASLLLIGKEVPFIRFDTATLCHIRINSFHPLQSELIALVQANTL